MAVAIPPAKAGPTEAVVLVVADQGVVVQLMGVLAVDAPEAPALAVVAVPSVGDDRIRIVALTAMVRPAGRVVFPVTIALSVVQSRAVGVDLIASIASLQRVGAAVSRDKAGLKGKAVSKAKAGLKSKAVSRGKAVSKPKGGMSPKAVLMVKTALNAGIAPRSGESASVVIASNGRDPGSVGAPIAVVHPVRNAPVQAVMTSGVVRAVVAGIGMRPVRPLNRINARERSYPIPLMLRPMTCSGVGMPPRRPSRPVVRFTASGARLNCAAPPNSSSCCGKPSRQGCWWKR